ncbi:MAG: DUF3800 domain-containing protein [Terriglobia bacterium]|nr:DUF3800 domain-containing protein [Terriglobia bacterium]
MQIVAIPTPTHLAFSDESQQNIGRFRGLGIITLPAEHLMPAQHEVSNLLAESGVTEFKWSKLRTARDRFAAVRIIEWVVRRLGTIRIDALTWDTKDSRHNVRSRDDQANFHRMYYHLFRNVLRTKWPVGACWRLYPDEQDSVNWNGLDEYLYRASMSSRMLRNPESFKVMFQREFSILQLQPCCSHEYPLIQVADLFVGMAVFSRERFDRYREWFDENTGQEHLYRAKEKFTGGESEKCTVLYELEGIMKKHRMPISFRSSRGLRTRKQSHPLNFWNYEPQHEADKAPAKNIPQQK